MHYVEFDYLGKFSDFLLYYNQYYTFYSNHDLIPMWRERGFRPEQKHAAAPCTLWDFTRLSACLQILQSLSKGFVCFPVATDRRLVAMEKIVHVLISITPAFRILDQLFQMP